MTAVPGSGCARERGSATVVVAAVCIIIVLLGFGLAAVVAAANGAARARTAADLSALAGARAAVDALIGVAENDPCAVAAGLAHHNGADVLDCAIDDHVNVTTIVAVPIHGAPRWLPTGSVARATARAGPQNDAGPPDTAAP